MAVAAFLPIPSHCVRYSTRMPEEDQREISFKGNSLYFLKFQNRRSSSYHKTIASYQITVLYSTRNLESPLKPSDTVVCFQSAFTPYARELTVDTQKCTTQVERRFKVGHLKVQIKISLYKEMIMCMCVHACPYAHEESLFFLKVEINLYFLCKILTSQPIVAKSFTKLCT